MKKQPTVICTGCWKKAATHEKMIETTVGPMHRRCAKERGFKRKPWSFATDLVDKYPKLATSF